MYIHVFEMINKLISYGLGFLALLSQTISQTPTFGHPCFFNGHIYKSIL